MGKKRSKRHSIGTISSQQQFDWMKPKYNGHLCGHGVHGDVKYNRRKFKSDTSKLLNEWFDC